MLNAICSNLYGWYTFYRFGRLFLPVLVKTATSVVPSYFLSITKHNNVFIIVHRLNLNYNNRKLLSKGVIRE